MANKPPTPVPGLCVQACSLPDGVRRLSLRPAEAAAALGIGERLLWEMTNRGEIPCARIGRAVLYPVAELERWLSAQAAGGGR